MKNGKRFVFVVLILVLLASTLMAVSGPGKWAPVKKGQNLTVNIGRAGLSIVDSFYSGTANIYRLSDYGYHPPKGFFFTQSLLGTKFYDLNWNRIEHVTGAVYVFFDLRPQEQRALQANRLGIYFFDTWKGAWVACPTKTTNGGTRAVCRIRTYGVYGLMFRDP